MLENFPLSGFAICYGPLALVIIGFITFAVITDAHARRTYLRRLDPRPEVERLPDAPIPVDKPTTAQTPAGAVVTLMPADNAPTEQGPTGPNATAAAG